MQDAKGNDVDLSVYKGKVLLIINVASKWYFLIFVVSHIYVFFKNKNYLFIDVFH